jgi:replicative DNA helicase
VSVTEIAPRGGDEFERTPPHDVAAEQCVLGGMLMSKDAISDVLEVIRPSDHYRPAHQIVHEVILDLYSRGEPADAVTVANELTKRGEIARMGGAPYLHTLIACVPTAANAGYYARIVRERAILRRLVEAGTRIVQLGYAGDGEADEIVDRAEAEVYGVTDRRVSEDYRPLSEIMPGALDEIEAIGSRGGGLTGVPTGFADLDALTNGLHPGQMIVIAARPALGKALALDTPLPTPTGWTTMGEVRPGDHLIGADGRPTCVLAATEVMTGRPCYEVAFSTGEVIVADARHQWLTHRGAGSATAEVLTTEQIAARIGGGRPGHAIPTTGPLVLPEAELPVTPYAMGVWLGFSYAQQRGSAVTDPEIAMRAEAEGVLSLCDLLLTGPGDDKRIPMTYLRASEAQRRALLAGILDIAGTVLRSGAIRLEVASSGLARDVRELLLGLGYRCPSPTRALRGRNGDDSSARHVVRFTVDDQVFRLSRKQQRHKELSRHDSLSTRLRHIVDVRRVPSRPVRCVQVDSADRLYLAGRGMIPTHNSTLALDLARAASVKGGLTAVIFSLEMSRNEITMRLLSAEARVPLHSMRTGQMGEDDWARLARRMSEVVDAPLFIDDSPNMSMMEIRAKCRRLKQRHDLRLVIIDYLQLMSSPKRVENRQQEVSDLSRSLKLLAKELDVPVVAVAQLNRGPEQRTDKRPLLSDLRESGCLTADTTLLRSDTGTPVTFSELVEKGCSGISVWSLDEQRRLVSAPLVSVFSSGTKEVFRLKLRSGREVKASGNHRFLTFEGWKPLEELAPKSRLAIPRHLPEPIGSGLGWSNYRIGLLAHLIGDGCVLRKQPLHYTSEDEQNLAYVEAAARAEFGITPRRVVQGNWQHTYLPAPYRCTHGKKNPLHIWFAELGIEDLHSYEKRIPQELYRASRRELALFLHHLWSTDGSVTEPSAAKHGIARIYYATSSRELADGVALLLARFGIVSRIRTVRHKKSPRPGYTVDVSGGPSMRLFCEEIGVHGARGLRAARLLAETEGRPVNTNVDTLPRGIWDLVKTERCRAGVTERQLQAAIELSYCGSTLYKSNPSRRRLLRIAAALDSDVLRAHATDDVFWDEVLSVESLGQQPVYDATVKGTHNFIADGVVAHNSIEQDSDVVILLHREDAYERESPRAGEADFIVAKHRNGPTATVTVAFQGHYSRFADMAGI